MIFSTEPTLIDDTQERTFLVQEHRDRIRSLADIIDFNMKKLAIPRVTIYGRFITNKLCRTCGGTGQDMLGRDCHCARIRW